MSFVKLSGKGPERLTRLTQWLQSSVVNLFGNGNGRLFRSHPPQLRVVTAVFKTSMGHLPILL